MKSPSRPPFRAVPETGATTHAAHPTPPGPTAADGSARREPQVPAARSHQTRSAAELPAGIGSSRRRPADLTPVAPRPRSAPDAPALTAGRLAAGDLWAPAASSSARSATTLPGRAGEPEVRSVVAALPGRGEDLAAFAALGERLALDGHRLITITGGASRIPAIVETRVPGVPFVLLGSDTGALAAVAMTGSPAVRPDGLVLLGIPLLHVPVAGLPLEDPSPRILPDLPILLMHGADDEVSPLPLVRMTTRTARQADLEVLPGGHDLLTGPGRRCVAARTLLFLEMLRSADTAPTQRALTPHTSPIA
ncbi:alpha/beta hydrolase [Frankia sp. AgB32]|uniref:alpha/beta hydrolase n=1 Tax=Frankia sp. AgB32 TaxID=631119 RepID=UPI00200C787D|nr:alpha/beta hydrolase [Frankia sp. AgB32]MCK9895871.1 alpha/beta hydrolase [Frankia sp. AgB32]